MVYKKDQLTDTWRAETLLMSQHGDYEARSWSLIPGTLS